MDEQDRPVVERETTVINAGGSGGGGGVLAAIIGVLIVGLLAFLFLGGYFEKAADKVDVNVNVDVPKVELPDIKIETPSAPSTPSEPANDSGT